jgi:hypothetical protein
LRLFDGYLCEHNVADWKAIDSAMMVGRDRSRGWFRLCLSPLAEPAERNYRNGLHRLHSWSGSHTVA